MDMIEAVFKERGAVSILDLGRLESYWNIVDKDYLVAHKVTILLLNLPDDVMPVKRADIFKTESGDGCALAFPDNSFDICHSNSVIEHVGSWRNKEAFALEVTRVAKMYFYPTPNYWFPWEPQFGFPIFHWLPEPLRLWIVRHYALGWQARANDVKESMKIMEYASLLNYDMFSFLYPDAEIKRERLLGITRSFTAIKR